jgi:hypothetical protein
LRLIVLQVCEELAHGEGLAFLVQEVGGGLVRDWRMVLIVFIASRYRAISGGDA